MITRFGTVIIPQYLENENLEGGVSRMATPGTRDQVAPPHVDNNVAALRAENEFLRQCLYHKATWSEERDFNRWMKFCSSVSTTRVAKAVDSLSNRRFAFGGKPVQLPQQFIYRLIYAIIENIVGEAQCRWKDKPNGTSKLKWLWRNNLLFLAPFAINSLEALFNAMAEADKAQASKMFKALEVWLSKR